MQYSDCESEENYIDCGIKDISSLQLKSKTTSLNFHYNNIVNINGLNHLSCLHHLDISSNLIVKISGLDSLCNLRTLNLSANKIKKLEGLSKLQQLVKLNLSYNEISDVSGLTTLPNLQRHPLTSIELHGNRLRLMNPIIRACQPLSNLRQLTLAETNSTNPVCSTPDYRAKMLKGLPDLRILDSCDRSGQSVTVSVLADIPGLEQFMDYLSSSTEVRSSSEFESTAVRRHQKTDMPRQQQNNNNADNFNGASTPVHKTEQAVDSELKLRLLDLEEKLMKLTDQSQSKQQQQDQEFDNKAEPERQTEAKKKADQQKTIARLMREQDIEKQRRIETENKLQILVTRYKELQLAVVNDRRSRDDATKATERLSTAYSNEKSARQSLESQIKELQDVLRERDQKNDEKDGTIQSLQKDLQFKLDSKDKELMNKTDELLQMQRGHEEGRLRQQTAEASLAATRRQFIALEDQLEQMQATLSKREREYQSSMAGKFSLESKELRDYVAGQVEVARDHGRRELDLFQERLTDSNNRYKDLEDEFRLALHMEADRHEKLERSYRSVFNDHSSLQKKFDFLSRKEDESRSLIAEMTSLVRDQKAKLMELSKSKQEIYRDSKERIMTLEAHLEEARKQMLQFELTKQENKKVNAKLSAHESVIEGLKCERKLWSEELAQQGYLLTQDRSKLECKIDAHAAEINTLKVQLEEEAQLTKSKCQIIESQTVTIMKMKEGLAEKDAEVRRCGEQLLMEQRDLETQLETAQKHGSELRAQVDKLTARKEMLKDMVAELQEKLDESVTTQEMVNKKWKEKSELIAKLENQVVQMKNFWEKKTADLEEERDEAVDKYNQLSGSVDREEDRHRQQLVLAEKEREFVRQEAQERVLAVEEEMRLLLLEMEREKSQVQARLRVLNRAVRDLGTDARD